LTTVFSGRPARGMMNRLMDTLGPLPEAAPAFPLAGNAIGPLRAAAEAQGSGDCSPLWAGQCASACREVSAVEVTRWLAEGWG
jgi:nitronate monooxygenase